jgi:hypothetical protein
LLTRDEVLRTVALTHPWHDLHHLAPQGEEALPEGFERWHQRVRAEIPDVPECVARNWLHRHWDQTPYDWLPLLRMRFEKQRWNNATILDLSEGTKRRRTLEYWSQELGREGSPHQRCWLGRYMLEHKTWPAPIIVLDNARGLADPGGVPLGLYHLIEGHMRSAFHHYLATRGLALDAHEVWVAGIVTGQRERRRNRPQGS